MRSTLTGAACASALAVFVLAPVACHPAPDRDEEPAAAPAAMSASPVAVEPAPHARSGFLYGRITALDGEVYEGRLRWGGDQEAFWGDFFNGAKDGNPWAAHAPLERRPKEGRRIEIFGIELGGNRANEFSRLFMARFGDVARVEAELADVHVTLKSGTVVTLDRFAAGDIDDGVRVWDVRRGVVDLDARWIRIIEFLPTAPLADAPGRLHGVVRTRQGNFTGFIQWNQQDGVSTDTLDGRTDNGEVRLPYDTIRAIARYSRDTALVTLRDGREMVLSNSREIGRRHRGIYVDDARYGRVLILWDAFERVDFTPAGDVVHDVAAGGGPAYGDFPAGRPLSGSVSTLDGRRLDGRLVYDFDESETTETLDVSFASVDYAIPFGLIASIVPPGREGRGAGPGRVTLHDGEELLLERSGDLGERNAGMLVFVAGSEHPEYVPWTGIDRIDFDRPAGAVGVRR
jgi:hypothetical protein